MTLFAERGFDGTSTREIAVAAGINEAIIFRHFPSKEDLYWAVLSERLQKPRSERIRDCLEAGGEDQAVLAEVASRLLERTAEDAAITRLLLFSALRNRGLSDRFFRTYMAEAYKLVSDYVSQRIGEGRFRPVDPMVAARGFLGMIVYHYLVQELFGGERQQRFEPHELGKQIADLWLNGIARTCGPPTANSDNQLNEAEFAGSKRTITNE